MASPLLLRSRASIRAILEEFYARAPAFSALVVPAIAGCLVQEARLLRSKITCSEFQLLFGVDVASPRCGCVGSTEFASLRGAPELGMGSPRHLNAFMTDPAVLCGSKEASAGDEVRRQDVISC
ncbi:hypothetical protein MUK42_07441 [Musa troglodytarum]|uniref:Uncharacterized protein n=1 Tax=Musa troglodytarum TaxID=320322 RepID=A0A9E7GY21_9LILI|nr:hypothetical protein MUK42_07441 [Musa troglodytarum]